MRRIINRFPPGPSSPRLPSLYPDAVAAIGSPVVGGRGGAGGGEVAEGGEELLHLLLQDLVAPLGVVLGALAVAQLDLRHGVLLPLLVQLFVEAQHLRLQLQVALLQAGKEAKRRDSLGEQRLLLRGDTTHNTPH